MEHIKFTFPATHSLSQSVQVGVVASGDLEALYQPTDSQQLEVAIITSQENSTMLWRHLFERISAATDLPAGKLTIHDSGATPGVARLRIEQTFEEAKGE
ncbi:malonate decarboxylase acyl carrier protein [Celerinatantimonas yamalensis]|uniref:Malonate decarboxylase acyl carrier protein n=1 Tax=Celerinatantimonas yamalensis TaxID=559956 RepID=A0ABW9G553_9GAMM